MMPVIEGRWVLELRRRIRLFLNVEAGFTGAAPERRGISAARERLTPAHGEAEDRSDAIEPQNIVWIFGSGRTGSTWLGRMLGDLEDHSLWHEPYVGEIFGTAYYVRAWERQHERDGYILSRPYKEVWLRSIRAMVLDGARARYPGAGGYLVIKEPHGSIAAPLLMEALPESRMVFLIRDPRDVVASRLDAHKKDSWTRRLTGKSEETLADRDPDAFVRAAAELYLRDVEKVREAFDAFGGRKVLVRYESLRADTLGELKRTYSTLGIPVAEEELRRVVEKRAWESIPDHRKGPGKSHRKASPGGWREDLSPGQAASVEEITAAVLEGFYAG